MNLFICEYLFFEWIWIIFCIIKEDPEPEEKTLEYLRHNFGPDVSEKMKDTVFQRRTIIRRHMSKLLAGFEKIPSLMPRLFDMEGLVITLKCKL